MHLESSEMDQLLGRDTLPGLTTCSITQRAALDTQLREYSSKGWIPAFEESFPGVYAVGSAVLTPDGTPVAGVSISFLRNESDPTQIESMGKAVLDAAQAICRRIAPQYAYQATRRTAVFNNSHPASETGERPGLPGTRASGAPNAVPKQKRERV